MQERAFKILCFLSVLNLAIFLLAYASLRRPNHPAQLPPTPLARNADRIFGQTPSDKNAFPANGHSNILNPVKLVATKVQGQVQRRLDEERVLDGWRMPIEFYGRVVDENTNVVASAQIDFSCNDLSQNGTSHYKAISDQQGKFSIDRITGKLLTVHVSKEGYYSSKRDNDSFYYAGQNQNFTPDASNPLVFHLRKKGNVEPLLNWGQSGPRPAISFAVARDGTPP